MSKIKDTCLKKAKKIYKYVKICNIKLQINLVLSYHRTNLFLAGYFYVRIKQVTYKCFKSLAFNSYPLKLFFRRLFKINLIQPSTNQYTYSETSE